MVHIDILVCVGVIEEWCLVRWLPLSPLRGPIFSQVWWQDSIVVDIVLILLSELFLRVVCLAITVVVGIEGALERRGHLSHLCGIFFFLNKLNLDLTN